MTSAAFRKYLAAARIGFREASAERGDLYGRIAFFGVILGIFSLLWPAIQESGVSLGASPRTLIWYLAMTEWILLSVPPIQFRIESEVRSGDVAYRFGHPISYAGSRFAEGVGMLAARAPLLFVTACAYARLFSGALPEEPARLALVAIFGWCAMQALLLANLCIGLSAFALGDVAPVSWVFQKVAFVLGGLMLPLELYPPAVLRAAELTPFPSLLYGPASFVIAGARTQPAELALSLAAWTAVASALAALAFRRAERTLELNGG